MRAVGIKVLKNRLSEYIKMAAGGETVLVTDRDRVVAEIGPPRLGRAEALEDALLSEAVRAGWVRPPVRGGESPPPRIPVAPLADILDGLDLDRSDR